MVDYINNRKFYSASNEFLSGSNAFSGYVLRRDQVFTDLGLNPLTAAPSYSTDLAISDYFRDRILTDELLLPHALSSIQVNVNDILTNRMINERFALLNDNNTYLYKSLQSPNNYLPASTSVRFATLSSNPEQFVWSDTFADGVEYTNSTDYQLYENIEHGLGVISNYSESVFTIFAATSSTFLALTGNQTTFAEATRTDLVGTTPNELTYGNITSMDYSNGFLYVCDKGRNAVYKYDVSSYLTGDSGFSNIKVLVDSIGAIGTVKDKGQFKSPSLVACKSDAVAIYDSGNYVLKVYDNNFNYKLNLNTGNYRREPAVAMRYNKFTNELYVITQTTSRGLKLYRVQSDFTISPAVELVETLEDDEVVKEITFSENDSNYWYLTTTQAIYKKLINKPSGNIGAYDAGKMFSFTNFIWNYAVFTWNSADILWNNAANRTSEYGNFIGLNIEPSTSNNDIVFMLKYGRFYKFNEPNEFLNLLDFYNKTNYDIADIAISNREFVQPAVYNKEIYKLISNLLAIKNNIIGRYYGAYDFNGVYRLLGYNYDIDLENFVIDNIKNFILHQNEGLNYYTLNRTLTKIFNLQQTLLSMITIEIEGLVPYPLTSNTLVVE